MKTTQQKPSTSKLLKKYDMELKSLLLADLKAYRAKVQSISNHQSAVKKAA